MTPVALIASSVDKPMFGSMSITSDLANKTKYTTLTRLSFTMSYLAEAIRVTLLYHNWTSVAIVRNKDSCSVPFSGIASEFQGYNITITNDLTVDFYSQDSLSNALMILKMTARSKQSRKTKC